MHKEHYIFELPSDRELSLFRYMDFRKLEDLITTSELYHSALIKMGDEHEGNIPEKIGDSFIEQVLKNEGKDAAEGMRKVVKPNERLKKETFISSWNMLPSESFAMWKLYTTDKNAVAIKSSIERLIEAFQVDDEFTEYIGQIKYHDGKRYVFRGNLFDPILYKWDYYKFESEVRVAINHYAKGGYEELKTWPVGIRPKINLETLIESIYLAPFAEEEQYNKVNQLIESIGLNVDIYESGIKDKWSNE